MVLAIGIAGAALILFAFILEQMNVWQNDSLVYDAANLVGGALLIVYGIMITAYPFVVLNSVWALVSLRDVVADCLKKKNQV